MSEKQMQAFIWIVVNSKGGVGKTFTAREFIATMLHYFTKKQITLLFVDDNNNVSTKDNDVFRIEKYNVKDGIEASQTSFFNVLNGEHVVIDAGGGNDTNFIIDGITQLGLNEYVRFIIPILKDEDDVENLVKTHSRIRNVAPDAEITIVLNKATSTDKETLKCDFPFLFKDKELLSDDIKKIMSDKKVSIATIVETELFSRLKISEINHTLYTLGSNIIDSVQRLKDASKGDKKDYAGVLAKTLFHKQCNDYFKDVYLPFFKKCGFKI